jgi:hypothetical protein
LNNYLRVFADRDILPMLGNSVVLRGGFGGVGNRPGRCSPGSSRAPHPESLGRVDAALSDSDAADHEKHRLDSALAPRSGILNGMLQQFFGIETLVFNAFSMAG